MSVGEVRALSYVSSGDWVSMLVVAIEYAPTGRLICGLRSHGNTPYRRLSQRGFAGSEAETYKSATHTAPMLQKLVAEVAFDPRDECRISLAEDGIRFTRRI
jgi:hypothetical protein